MARINNDGWVAEALMLWDIDGTLVSCGPAGRLALERAVQVVTGLEVVPAVRMSGKTDPQILAEIMTLAGLETEQIAGLMPSALDEAEAALSALVREMVREGFIQPGIRELLPQLHELGARQTLVTGNTHNNAVLKVSTFGLDSFLDVPVGAYGTDHAERDCLVPLALGRVEDLRAEVYPPERTWVIGDTPHDLACARAAGVKCMLVGTGRDGFDSVRHLAADAVLPDLSDTGAAVGVLLGVAEQPA